MEITYNITFHSNWHCGSGLASGAHLDALVIKDKNGMPYIPGKTLKGIIKESVFRYISFTTNENEDNRFESFNNHFGYVDDNGETHEGKSFFSNANVNNYDKIIQHDLCAQMFSSIASTQINEYGVAENNSLRKIEVAVPCTLIASISNIDDNFAGIIEQALGLIKNMGTGRSRGLGRCSFSKIESDNHQPDTDNSKQENKESNNESTIRQYKCTLLTDVILSQKSGSEGNVSTLDFIPGSNFLGIVAKHYTEFKDDAFEVFHSGKVRFSDANPSLNGFRGLHIPASFYRPKLGEEKIYLHHYIEQGNENITKLQLKQYRNGYYDFSENAIKKVKTYTSFVLKSAHDSENRCSKKGEIYGYESLSKGLVLYFDVETKNTELSDTIESYLLGKHNLGKSRNSQYGAVLIEKKEYKEITSNYECINIGNTNYVTVYADSRLIFFDKYNNPTFTPSAEDLGFSSHSEIAWELSQIRTFTYAPWNGIRQCFDTDRCGIEKGSVFVVRSSSTPDNIRYVGKYNNEGFGKVIYNPAFLIPDISQENEGLAAISICNEVAQSPSESINLDAELKDLLQKHKNETDLFIKSLLTLKINNIIPHIIYNKVNEWVNNNMHLFKGDSFNSQWGTVRALATSHINIYDALFNNENGYLKKGVAKDKWDTKGRRDKLEQFVKNISTLPNEWKATAIINLASEMQKIKTTN